MATSETDVLDTMRVLAKWNPLGDHAAEIHDLDDYRTEAEDILFNIRLGLARGTVAEIVQNVLNGAFGLALTLDECRQPAQKIAAIAKRSQ